MPKITGSDLTTKLRNLLLKNQKYLDKRIVTKMWKLHDQDKPRLDNLKSAIEFLENVSVDKPSQKVMVSEFNKQIETSKEALKKQKAKELKKQNNAPQMYYATAKYSYIVYYKQNNGSKKPYRRVVIDKFKIFTTKKRAREDIINLLESKHHYNLADDSFSPQDATSFEKLIEFNLVSESEFLSTITDIISEEKLINTLMTSAEPIKYAFMEHVNEIAFKRSDGFCVPDALRLVYGELKKWDLTNDKLEEEFRSISSIHSDMFINMDWKLSKGITNKMLKIWCENKKISMYGMDLDGKVFIKHIVQRSQYPALIYYCVNKHMYVVTDKSFIKSVSEREKEGVKHVTNVFRDFEDKQTQITDIIEDIKVEDLKNYKNKFIMYSECQLDDILHEYFKLYNGLPMVTKTKGYHIISMKDTFGNTLMADHNRNDARNINYKSVKAVCEKLNIPFTNQSISAVVAEYEKRFFEVERIKLTRGEAIKLIKAQNNKCNKCKSDITKKYQIDHIKPLAAGGNNDISNLQALCIECHFEKTKEEQDNGEYVKIDETKSSFCNKTLDIIKSDLYKRWAFVENIETGIDTKYNIIKYIDLNKTRKNILFYSKYDLPVYSVMDEPKPFSGKIQTGFYYIETESYYPLRGNGWYSKPMIDYCLENGIITKDNIKYELVSSFNLKAQYFNEFINSVYDLFGDLGKVAINSWIGCFNKLSGESGQVKFLDNLSLLYQE